MILNFIKTPHKLSLISIIFFCFVQDNSIFAAQEPLIKVLIAKNNSIRIRSDKSVPLIISGQQFSKKKSKGITIKSNNLRNVLFFDKNKQKIHNLKDRESFQVSSSDDEITFLIQSILL